MKAEEYDCSNDFDKPITRKRYKYLIVYPGDLDLNGCMMLRTREDVKKYLSSSWRNDNIYCVFNIKDVSEQKWVKKE